MRADRLLSLLMLLQTHGKSPAAELAKELNVSVRTIYRDLQALERAGIPIYTQSGPGGGCGMLEEFRTDLTGLTEGEVRALFLLNVPGPIAELGLSQEFKGALHKLAASIPGPLRGDDSWVRQRIYLDWESPKSPDWPETDLITIQKALWQDRKMLLTLELGFETIVEQLVEPYGLVNRDGVWFLICKRVDQFRVYHVSRIQDTVILNESFVRDEEFNLKRFWAGWWETHEANRPSYKVTARVSGAIRELFPRRFFIEDQTLESAVGAASGEWTTVNLHFTSIHEARRWILASGCGLEVLEPEGLRQSIIDFADQISAVYEGSSSC
jgi:predicted DNA-binding transcriptional regulator YafY